MAQVARAKWPTILLLIFCLSAYVLYNNSRWFAASVRSCNKVIPKPPPWIASGRTDPQDQIVPANREDWKVVLFWTGFWGCPHPDSIRGTGVFRECQVKDCFITTDRSFIGEADAVLYHIFDFDQGNLPERKPRQYNVFYEGEPATYVSGIPDMPEGFFDMIASYRLDIDVPLPYTYRLPLQRTRKNFATGKTKLVAWFASKCPTHSRREDYVAELKKHVEVDAYGKCGTLTCSRENEDVCDKMLGRDYKFYLAFENSLCQDYVTEKPMRALAAEVVPVVMAFSSFAALPPKSFINVADFADPANLAAYLKYLDGNDTAYNEYFEWRYNPETIASHGKYAADRNGYCKLCELLHKKDFKPQPYMDAKSWFMKTAQCKKLPGKDPDVW